MATLLLTAGAQAAIGAGAFGTLTALQSSLILAGATAAGSVIDRLLFAPKIKQSFEGPRLNSLRVTSSTEGEAIVRGYGRFKVGGNIIWATELEEEVIVEKQKQEGKGGGSTTTASTTYDYYGNFAIGLCEGEIGTINRVWADGKELRLSDYTYRVYLGTEAQSPDSLIESKEGSGNAPAYRGLAYIVFERMPLQRFGNRIPQFAVEITRPVRRSDNNGVANLVEAVCLIPGTGEFFCDTDVVQRVLEKDDNGNPLSKGVENNHLKNGLTNWENAMDQMSVAIPNTNTVMMIACWFGDDLRMGECEIKPRVDSKEKETEGGTWTVAGLSRSTADRVSLVGGRPAFGGTPSDASVVRAIQDLKARGYDVMFCPFILMDIPPDNTLPNPYSNSAAGAGQAAFPWRGRITPSPAIGYTGAADKTSAVATQVSSFVGTALSTDFSSSGTTITYSGTAEWSYRRFILHYAELCKLAGGVDYFLIGTEMVAATTSRSNASTFPFVDELVTLAAQVALTLPASELSYAADWSEYHSHRPSDGSNDVYFHLDPLWANSNIDFVAIDNYLPLSDWRDGFDHLDAQNYSSIYDIDYLKSNIEGGEYYDWFYASFTDRINQTRTNITDGSGKPWVFRNKDIRNWWENSHYNRPGGTESVSTTAWVAESKPVWFTEFGVPALDKATNQPNVFFDPKSSESFIPYFSTGARDDKIQYQYLRAMLEYWYNDPMIGGMALWCYDARPWPTFPQEGQYWGDKDNWFKGHWINGRIDSVNVSDLLVVIAEDYGFTSHEFSRAYGSCDGYLLEGVMSFRDAVEPLAAMFSFELVEAGNVVKAVSYYEASAVVTIDLNQLADLGEMEPVTVTTSQNIDVPQAFRLKYLDTFNDYELAAVDQRRETFDVQQQTVIDTPVVIDYTRAQQAVDALLYATHAGRTSGNFAVMPELLRLEPGDVVSLKAWDFSYDMKINRITDGNGRRLETQSIDRHVLVSGPASERTIPNQTELTSVAPLMVFMDLPLLQDGDVEWAPYMVGYSKPWKGVNVYRSPEDTGYSFNTTLLAPGFIGETSSSLSQTSPNVWDEETQLDVTLYSGSLVSKTELAVLGGENAIAIKHSTGWEVLQFVNASLVAPGKYRLSKLLRGQLGTEAVLEDTLAIGARVVVLNLALSQLETQRSDIGLEYYYRYGPADEPISSDNHATLQLTFQGVGFRPYAPCQVRWTWDSGDVTITWIRRTRIQGDSWSGEVPWGETIRQFEADILDGSDNVVRTVTVDDATTFTYTAAQQSADGISAPFDVVIYQMSEFVGRGTGERTTIDAYDY